MRSLGRVIGGFGGVLPGSEAESASSVVELDLKQVISCLNNVSLSCAWEIFPILSRIHMVGKTFQACSWSWVPRSANAAADFVASNHTLEMCNFGWVDRPLSSLVKILTNMACLAPRVLSSSFLLLGTT